MTLLNLPNTLTLCRIFLVPVIVVLLYFPSRLTTVLACVCFMVASFTDFIDGYIARRTNMVTRMGKFLDPLADKVLISSVLIMLVQLGWVEAWVTIVILCRELIITGLRAIAADEGVIIAADTFGKAKTIMQMMALLPLMLHFTWFGFNPAPLGEFLLYTALVLTVFSGLNYLFKFYTMWTSQKADKGSEDSKTQSPAS